MSKFDGRVAALIRKTHMFVSYADFCLARDHLRWLFEREPKPCDLDKWVAEFNALKDKLDEDDNAAALVRLEEILALGPAVWLKAMIPVSEDYCYKYPNGIWVTIDTAKYYLECARARRDYLARRARER